MPSATFSDTQRDSECGAGVRFLEGRRCLDVDGRFVFVYPCSATNEPLDGLPTVSLRLPPIGILLLDIAVGCTPIFVDVNNRLCEPAVVPRIDSAAPLYFPNVCNALMRWLCVVIF